MHSTNKIKVTDISTQKLVPATINICIFSCNRIEIISSQSKGHIKEKSYSEEEEQSVLTEMHGEFCGGENRNS